MIDFPTVIIPNDFWPLNSFSCDKPYEKYRQVKHPAGLEFQGSMGPVNFSFMYNLLL